MNYDKWKTQTPPDPEDNKCYYCGEPCEDSFCSRECERADYAENCLD